MSNSTTFVNGTVIQPAWLNDLNASVYNGQDFTGNQIINVKNYPYFAKGNGIADDTAAISSAISAAYNNGYALYIPGGTYLVSDISLTITGGRLSKGLVMFGAGKNVTIFKQNNTVSSMLTFVGSTPTSTPTSMQLFMSGIAFQGSTSTVNALTLDGIAQFTIENCQADTFLVGLNLKSSLIGEITNCIFSSCTTNVKTVEDSTGAYCNNIRFNKCGIGYATKYGMDFSSANGISVNDCDIEGNGVASPTSTVTFGSFIVNWTNHGLSSFDPVVFTTTGTMPTGIIANKIYYVGTTTTNTFQIAATVGGAALDPSSGGSGTFTALSFNSGPIVIRNSCINEFGASSFTFKDNWFEGNYGAALRTEYMSNAFGFKLVIEGAHILGANPGQVSLAIGHVAFLSIRDIWIISGTDVAYVSADNFICDNSYLITLNKPEMASFYSTGNGWTHVRNSWWNGLHHIDGEVVQWTGTGTGFSTAPTYSVKSTIQGNHVRMVIPPGQNTSNATTYTITGMPAQLIPRANIGAIFMSTDNGVNAISYGNIQNTGVINMFYGPGNSYTASGTKGIGNNVFVSYDI